MMKQARRFKHDLEYEIDQRRNPEKHDDKETERNREQDLTEVEPGRRRHRHDKIPDQPSPRQKMSPAQRPFPLQEEQQREERQENRTAQVIEQRDRFHRAGVASGS